MFALTPVWIINDLQIILQNINTVTGVELLIEDSVVLVQLSAALHTLGFAHQPGLAVQTSRLEQFIPSLSSFDPHLQ